MRSLYSYFEDMEDPRQDAGKRYELASFLSMITLAYMSGHHSMQSVRRYFVNNKTDLVDMFGLKHGVPSYTIIRLFLNLMDFKAINAAFISWAGQYFKMDEKQWLSMDGKCLGSTVTDVYGSAQNFQALVGAFMSQTGITVGYGHYENGKKSEAASVRELITQLERDRYIITLDALHCEKKL